MNLQTFTFLTVMSYFAVTSSSPPIPIPVTHPGYVFQGTRNSEIVVEVFLELNCKDSKEAWPVLKQMASQYKRYQEHMSIILHIFPLPYHRSGFLSSQAWNLVIDNKPDESVSFIEEAFSKLDEFTNKATKNMTNEEIESKLAELVTTSTGIPDKDFHEHFDDFRKPTISHWKYCVKRGVAGTPWYFVNGVDLALPGEAVSMETWEAIIEPILNATLPLKFFPTKPVSETTCKPCSSGPISFPLKQLYAAMIGLFVVMQIRFKDVWIIFT